MRVMIARSNSWIGLLAFATSVAAWAPPAAAQYRGVRVYNPARHYANRTTMNNRAATRAAEQRRLCREYPRLKQCQRQGAVR